jgi:hypothetical protein
VLDDVVTDHVFSVIWDDGKGVNLKAVQNESFTLYRPRERVEPISISAPVSSREARTRRTRRGFRRVRSYVAA